MVTSRTAVCPPWAAESLQRASAGDSPRHRASGRLQPRGRTDAQSRGGQLGRAGSGPGYPGGRRLRAPRHAEVLCGRSPAGSGAGGRRRCGRPSRTSEGPERGTQETEPVTRPHPGTYLLSPGPGAPLFPWMAAPHLSDCRGHNCVRCLTSL